LAKTIEKAFIIEKKKERVRSTNKQVTLELKLKLNEKLEKTQ